MQARAGDPRRPASGAIVSAMEDGYPCGPGVAAPPRGRAPGRRICQLPSASRRELDPYWPADGIPRWWHPLVYSVNLDQDG